MKRTGLLLCVAAVLCAQQFKFNLDQLAAKASNSIDLSVGGATLKIAAKFLDASDPEEAQVKKMISGLEGIYIKRFEFKQGGMWSEADLQSIRQQLHAPEWERMLGYKSTEDGEN